MHRRGWSLIEVLLVIGIMVVLGLGVFQSLSGRRSGTALDSTTKKIVVLLRQAQSLSMSQSSGTSWGVYFANTTTSQPFYALFSGLSYSTSSRVDRHLLDSGVQFSTSSIASGGDMTVLFSQIYGYATTTNLQIYVTGNSRLSSTISVASSGAVSF